MSVQPRALTSAELRSYVRGNAQTFATMLDCANLPDRKLDYDDVFAVAARLLVEDGPVWCEGVSLATGLSEDHIHGAIAWREVVNLGCAAIEATREQWRAAWPFLRRIVIDELRPFSNRLADQRGVAR